MSQKEEVWAAADMAFGLMAFINIIAIMLLTPTIKSVTSDYLQQRKNTKTVEFKKQKCRVQGNTDSDLW